MLVGIIIGICIMSVLACIGSWAIENDLEGLGIFVLGPAAWVSWIGYGIIAWAITVFKPHNIRKEDLENLPHFYKMLGKKWCLCRWYGWKDAHPIRYHILFPMRVNIIERPKKMC